MDNTNAYYITSSLIDAAGFYFGNYLIHKGLKDGFPKPNLSKTAVFGIADLAVRNGYITYMQDSQYLSGSEIKRNAYIGLVAFIGNTAMDLIQSKDMTESLKKNALLSVVGIGTNSVLDKWILPVKYT